MTIRLHVKYSVILDCFFVKVEDSRLCFYFILSHFNSNLIILDLEYEYSMILHVTVTYISHMSHRRI